MEELLNLHAPAILETKAEMLLPRLALALLLGGAIAWRPWKRKGRPKPEVIHTQILMCVAGALVAAVIGDSLAKAFGMVGLGGFIRFRSGLKDPRDAATLFVLIGLGMACGMGALELAVAGWGFLLLLFACLDRLAERRGKASVSWRLTLESDDVTAAEATVAKALRAEGVSPRASRIDPESRTAVFEFDGSEAGIDTMRAAWASARSVRMERLGKAEEAAA